MTGSAQGDPIRVKEGSALPAAAQPVEGRVCGGRP